MKTRQREEQGQHNRLNKHRSRRLSTTCTSEDPSTQQDYYAKDLNACPRTDMVQTWGIVPGGTDGSHEVQNKLKRQSDGRKGCPKVVMGFWQKRPVLDIFPFLEISAKVHCNQVKHVDIKYTMPQEPILMRKPQKGVSFRVVRPNVKGATFLSQHYKSSL